MLLKYATPKTYHKPYLIILRGMQQIHSSNRIWRNLNFLNLTRQTPINHQPRWFADKEDPKIVDILKSASQRIDEEMVKEVQAVFQFEIKDHGTYHIDLKNGKGSAGEGKPKTNPDAILITDLKNFLALFSGKLKPKLAVMMGKLKVGGNAIQALKLEKVLPKLRGEKA